MAPLEAPMVDTGISPAVAAMTIDDVPEGEKIVCYASVPYGMQPECLVLEAEEAIEFASAEAMTEMLKSKAPSKWNVHVKTYHVSLYRSNDRRTPAGFFEGKDGKTSSDFPYQIFPYVRCYVKPDPNDPETQIVAEHDKLQCRHIPKAVARDLHTKFNALTKLTDERREYLKPLLEWVEPKPPQVEPKVARWPAYETLVLKTAYDPPPPTERPKGPNSKQVKQVKAGKPATKATQRPSKKQPVRAAAEEEEEEPAVTQPSPPPVAAKPKKRSTDEASTSSAATAPGQLQFDADCVTVGVKCRKVKVGANAHCHIEGGFCYITEYDS